MNMLPYKKMVKVVSVTSALTLALGTTACYKHTFTVGTGAPEGRLVLDRWEHFWIAGIIGHHRSDVRQICPTGNATIEGRQTFLNGLVAGLTAGIYTPTTVRIRCAEGQRAEVDLDETLMGRIATDARFATWVAREMPERLSDVTAAQERARVAAPAP